MKIAGIVAEYNPFHNGHAYHVEHTRAEKEGDADRVVAVMSGYFTQRGEPALLDPFVRAEMALRNGVDLVLALPTPWALASAETFAFGGVSMLDALGVVDLLSFGSEQGDVTALEGARRVLDDPRTALRMRGLMDTGLSYAVARRQAVFEQGGEARAALLDSPNNTLGIEYLGALTRLDSRMTPFTVKRMGAAHDALSPIGGMASASYIREVVRSGRAANVQPFVPNTVCRLLLEAIERGVTSREELAERAVLAVLRLRSREELSALPAVSEGLENRLYNAIREAGDLETLFTLAKTKRYPRTRLQRLVYSAFLGITADMAEGKPPYMRVLGATEGGREILRLAKERGTAIPLVTRVSQLETLSPAAQRLFALENRVADLYALTLQKPTPCGGDMTAPMIML